MGVEVQTITPGDGVTYPKTGQTVVVHYTGTLTSGVKFDSSRDRGQPFKFTIGKGDVIMGWDQGLAQMSVGQRAKLTCSPDFGTAPEAIPESSHRTQFSSSTWNYSALNKHNATITYKHHTGLNTQYQERIPMLGHDYDL